MDPRLRHAPSSAKAGPRKTSYIRDAKARSNTYYKRRAGLIKKAMELCSMTGCEMALVCISPDDAVHYSFVSHPLGFVESLNAHLNAVAAGPSNLPPEDSDGPSKTPTSVFLTLADRHLFETKKDRPAEAFQLRSACNIGPYPDESNVEIPLDERLIRSKISEIMRQEAQLTLHFPSIPDRTRAMMENPSASVSVQSTPPVVVPERATSPHIPPSLPMLSHKIITKPLPPDEQHPIDETPHINMYSNRNPIKPEGTWNSLISSSPRSESLTNSNFRSPSSDSRKPKRMRTGSMDLGHLADTPSPLDPTDAEMVFDRTPSGTDGNYFTYPEEDDNTRILRA